MRHELFTAQRGSGAYLNGIRKGQLRQTESGNVVIKHVAGTERWELCWRGDQTRTHGGIWR